MGTPLIDHLGLIMTPAGTPAVGDIPMRGASGGWTTVQTGAAPSGAVLQLDPSTGLPKWIALGPGSNLSQSESVSFNAVAGTTYLCTGSITGTLPNAPADSSECAFISLTGTVTLQASGTDTITQNQKTGLTQISVGPGMSVKLKYHNGIWGIVADSRTFDVLAPWQSNTVYSQGQLVTFQGCILSAKVAFTSGASFSAANWNCIQSPTTKGSFSASRTGVFGDGVVLMNSTVGDIFGVLVQYTLPPVANCPAGYRITVKDIGTIPRHSTIVSPAGTDTISHFGDTSVRLGSGSSGQYKAVTLQTDGTTWEIVNTQSVYRPLLSEEIFYLEDYGPTGTSDDTATFQACIDDAVSAKTARIKLANKNYTINHATRTDRGGNAVVALPRASDSINHLVIEGYEGGEAANYGGTGIFADGITGLAYSSANGPPSVFGGATVESSGATFAGGVVEFRNIVLVLPSNPTICGIDLPLSGAAIENVGVYTHEVIFNGPSGSITQPTSVYQFGIRTAMPGNTGPTRIGVQHDVQSMGHYTGLVMGTSHTSIGRLLSQTCEVGIGIVGAGQATPSGSGVNDPHGSNLRYVQTAHCPVHIAGWSVTGIQGLLGPAYIVCELWDIEDAQTGWQVTSWNLLDNASSYLHARMNYVRVKANVGIQTGLLTAGGLAHVFANDLST